MRLYRYPYPLPPDIRGSVVALGNFDGVHLGHQAVIAAATILARALGRPAGVLTFEPHPRCHFQPTEPPFLLTPWPAKARALQALAEVDALFTVPFNTLFAERSAERFIEEDLGGWLGTGGVVTGPDFAFGCRRGGSVATLAALAPRYGYSFQAAEPIRCQGGEIISSSRIRTLLKAGQPEEAARLLGRPWEISGRVQHGAGRGHQLGFPSANLALQAHLCPALGVYAVRVGVPLSSGALSWHNGVANIGHRPTFGGGPAILEAHLLDSAPDPQLYGKRLQVRLLAFLRPEQRFANAAALARQIEQDIAAARNSLSSYIKPR